MHVTLYGMYDVLWTIVHCETVPGGSLTAAMDVEPKWERARMVPRHMVTKVLTFRPFVVSVVRLVVSSSLKQSIHNVSMTLLVPLDARHMGARRR